MKKNILLSFCVLCACGLSSCSSFSDENYEVDPNDLPPVIDATVDANNRCGVDGIGCNDTALINYTKTEADYRAYGERTPRDQLYTQAAAGNNLTATIPPDIEEDVVTEYEPMYTDDEPQDAFANTGADNLEPQYPLNNYSGVITHPGYQVFCQQDCGQFANIPDGNIASEFTEEAFNIDDYARNNGIDGENIEFIEIGGNEENVEVGAKKVTDSEVLTWDAQEGDTLRELLTEWSKMAGWKLLWNTNRNYTLSAGVMFKGKFTDVSSALVRAFARARPAPIATFYKGNRVIVVETMENENAY
ncbi:MAG: toxin co-regulated pilus biosynthesis Q family protein [Alphaproteobacteria bacterium]|nr:toxin co-regulated pilus biosynthesis Q family protein [Alphaproteobacteria bacterium]